MNVTTTQKAAPLKSAAIYLFPTAKLLFIAGYMFLAGHAYAQYQCKDNQGKTSFQDHPCPTEHRTISAPPANSSAAHDQIGSEQHIKKTAETLNRQLDEQLKANPPRPRPKITTAATASNTEAQSMPFDQCVAVVDKTALQLGLGWLRAPIIVRTTEAYIRRFCTDTGSVLITCSRPDQKMVTTKSPYDPSTGCS